MNEVFTRIMTALAHGITIGGEHFEFLAFGNSQIREHGAYFFASDEHVSVKDIRKWMGDFRSIRIVAKHAARLGQCFCEFYLFLQCFPPGKGTRWTKERAPATVTFKVTKSLEQKRKGDFSQPKTGKSDFWLMNIPFTVQPVSLLQRRL